MRTFRVMIAVAAALCAATLQDVSGFIVTEQTSCRRHVLLQQVAPAEACSCQRGQEGPGPGPFIAAYAVPALPYAYNPDNGHRTGPCTSGGSNGVPCTCGGGNGAPCTFGGGNEAPCTCGGGNRAPCTSEGWEGSCACGGKGGVCTCGAKKDVCTGGCACGGGKKRKDDCPVEDIAAEGISALFKAVHGGIKMVEHLAGKIHKEKKKNCGCAAVPVCGCSAAPSCGCRSC